MSWAGMGCCGPGPMGGLGLGPMGMPGSLVSSMMPVGAAAKSISDAAPGVFDDNVDALEQERDALEAQLAEVRRARGHGWPWWAKVGGGILAVAVVVKIARRWGS